MDVVLYTFSKKHNSTKRPSTGTGVTYACTLIEGCSIIQPVIKVIAPANTDLTVYNYAYISAFHRYYFVSNITYDITTFSIFLTVDKMASAKTAIGASSHYIERCSFEFDENIIDTMYPTKTNLQRVIVEPEKVGTVTPTIFGDVIRPSYIVGIIGGIAPDNVAVIGDCYNGSVVYFCLTQAQLGKLVASLLSSIDMYNIPTTEISESLQKQLINPLQYIHSIKCVPFTPNVSEQYVALAYYCGFQYVTIPGGENWKICKAPVIGELTTDNGYMEKRTTTIFIPVHPEYYNRGHWVLGAPATRYVFEAQPFGQIEIPSGSVLSATISGAENNKHLILYVTTVTDISTGDCTLFLGFTQDVKEAFLTVTKHIAIDVPVHQSIQDAMGYRQARRELNIQQVSAVKSFFEAGMGMLGSGVGANTDSGMAYNEETRVGQTKGDPIDTALNYYQKMLNTVDDATMANQVHISGNGNEGSYMAFNKDITIPRVVCYFSPLAEENNTERGRPLCAVRQISDIPGYIVTAGADISTGLTASEDMGIVNIMNGGFYYE